jgi:hypothetical protein
MENGELRMEKKEEEVTQKQSEYGSRPATHVRRTKRAVSPFLTLHSPFLVAQALFPTHNPPTIP